MTVTVFEYEYGSPLATRKSRKDKAPVSRAAMIVGLLIVVAAGLQAYGAWRLERYIIRLNSFRMLDAMLAPDDMKASLVQGVAISEVTIHVWLGIAWVCAFLLALSGVWTAVRRRFGWRMLWTGAMATLIAAGLTVAGGYVLEHYAGFPPQAGRIYAIAFLIHSAPGWVILGVWLTNRLFLQEPTPPQQPDNVSDASPEAAG